jgi:hypothetical protein
MRGGFEDVFGEEMTDPGEDASRQRAGKRAAASFRRRRQSRRTMRRSSLSLDFGRDVSTRLPKRKKKKRRRFF